MAGLFDFAYAGSDTPDSVRQAIEAEKNYQKAIKAKLPLAAEGSGIPESVRKAAQAALERGASNTAPPMAAVPEVAPAGVLGKAAGIFGRALGPVAAGYDGLMALDQKFGPTAYGNIRNAVEEGQTRRAMAEDPELAQRGQATVDRVVGGAMQGVAGLLPPSPGPTGLTEEELNAQNPNDVPQGILAPQQSPMEVPVEVAEAQPQSVPQAAAKAQVQQEAQRQQLETGAVKALSTGAVSRPEAAKKVVEADLARSGKEVTPEAKKALVAEELTNMKSMDNSQVGKYLSYALMAGGVLAAIFDKSGKAGDNFGQAFVRAQDQQIQLGLQNRKFNAAQKAAEAKNAIETYKLQQGDRNLNIKEKSVDGTIEYQGRKIDLGEESNDIRRETAAASNQLGYAGIAAANARSGASLNLKERQMAQQQAQYEGLLGLKQGDQELRREMFATDKEFKEAKTRQGNEGLLIQAAKARAATGPKGVKTDSKVAGEVVDQVADSQGLNLSKSAKVAAAEAFRYQVQNDPAAAADPVGTAKRILGSATYQSKPASWFGNGTTAIRRPKE